MDFTIFKLSSFQFLMVITQKTVVCCHRHTLILVIYTGYGVHLRNTAKSSKTLTLLAFLYSRNETCSVSYVRTYPSIQGDHTLMAKVDINNMF